MFKIKVPSWLDQSNVVLFSFYSFILFSPCTKLNSRLCRHCPSTTPY